ncbi:sigma-70 family RNA polymerase sigma factor [Crassaminicella thermophila]|uniref:Sigma-70 family RNA polymerase sigma factor n=1 Tax=Crassaminicella thermophila TaxID=2599308 RepID=A0A5C0SEA0_CRATE|nr:sigma-70 family RNA polymerase sigma factor [Crassaminicella thermophila]QEK11299.1 sigma-70 family RNA polymerase sigma factor [Crassaminicella thermophila]
MEYKMKDLVNRCKDGDRLAKEELLKSLMPLIITSIKKYYFGDEEFSDLIQEGGMKILREVEIFDEERGVPFLGYIKLKLKFLYMEKRKKVRNELSLQNKINMDDDEISFIDMLVDERENVEEHLLKEERYHALEEAIKRLTDKQKIVLKLCYMDFLNMKQIAERLGVHYQTVVKTKARALDKMRKDIIGC